MKIKKLRYLDGKKRTDNASIKSDGENDINSEESTIDDLILLKLKEISEDKNNIINNKMNFDLKA